MLTTVPLRHLELGGAGARLAPERGLALDPRRWAWQPKVDGTFVRAATDRDGRIASLLHRSGAHVSAADADGLVGLSLGLPDAVLLGELEAHTEAGVRARAARGWPALHLFDCARFLGRDVAARAYGERHGLLHRWQADVECYGEVQRADWWTGDATGRAHDARGRFCRAVPRDLRRLPIVPLARGRGAAEALWRSHVEVGGGEGLVAVRLDAPLGARGAKRKVKASETLDCVVLSVGRAAARLSWRGLTFVVSAKGKTLAPGQVVEVACDGWYERRATPRFARIVSVRADLPADLRKAG